MKKIQFIPKEFGDRLTIPEQRIQQMKIIEKF
jgi:hypothetical protein